MLGLMISSMTWPGVATCDVVHVITLVEHTGAANERIYIFRQWSIEWPSPSSYNQSTQFLYLCDDHWRPLKHPWLHITKNQKEQPRSLLSYYILSLSLVASMAFESVAIEGFLFPLPSALKGKMQSPEKRD